MTIKVDIKINNSPTILANANVAIDTKDFGVLTIKYFQIWKSKIFNSRLNDYINIKPCSLRTRPPYMEAIRFEDLDMWKIIERSIYEKYTRVAGKPCYTNDDENHIDFNEVDEGIERME